jgi:hypothetical protein
MKIFQKQLSVHEEMLLEEQKGDLITIESLPSCTRLCINVILIPESCKQANNNWTAKPKNNFVIREGMVLGSCSLTLFDEKFLLRQGKRELRLWPFVAFHPRMVCQTECFKKSID